MIIINEIKISQDKKTIDVSIETDLLGVFTNVTFWDRKSFKDESKSKDLSFLLSGVDNIETFTISNTDVDISFFEDVYFIEFKDLVNATSSLKLGVTINLSKYQSCILNNILKYDFNNKDLCDINVINPFMLLESIKSAFSIGYYNEGIKLMESLDLSCSANDCNNCGNTNDGIYYTGIKYN